MSYVHPEFLISADELAQQLDDQSLRIFDTSVLLHHGDGGYKAEPGREQYLAEHIAGAGFINLSETWSDTNSPYSNTVPELDALCAAIGTDGIGMPATVAATVAAVAFRSPPSSVRISLSFLSSSAICAWHSTSSRTSIASRASICWA